MPTEAEEREYVLVIPRIDAAGETVVVHAESNGSRPLDLKLTATDGVWAYFATIKQSQVSRPPLRDARNQLEPEKWDQTLRHVLLQERITPSKENEAKEGQDDAPDPAQDIEVLTSKPDTNSTLTILLRQKIEGIVQRLGHIDLTKDEKAEIDTFNWIHPAVKRADSLSSELDTLHSKYREKLQIIEELRKQSNEFIDAKKEHDEILLAKFCELLNEKKSKIRELEYLLEGATLDPKRAKEVEERGGSEIHKPEASRKEKRKQTDIESQDEEVEEDRDGDEETPSVRDEDEAADALDTTDDEDDDHDRGGGSNSKGKQAGEMDIDPPKKQASANASHISKKVSPPSHIHRKDTSTKDDNEDQTDDDEL